MQTTIEQTKIELIQWVAATNNQSLLTYLHSLQSAHTNEDWWDTISEAERQSIRAGEEDIKNGRTVPHSEARKIYEQWL